MSETRTVFPRGANSGLSGDITPEPWNFNLNADQGYVSQRRIIKVRATGISSRNRVSNQTLKFVPHLVTADCVRPIVDVKMIVAV